MAVVVEERLVEQAEIAFKAGMKEVIEWIQQNIPVDFEEYIDPEVWHSKLKEWGIK